MNRIALIFFLFNSFLNFGQEHNHIFKQSDLANNKVYKIFQYDASDSVNFISNFPNGYYSIFNDEGRIIKANFYLNSYNNEGLEIFVEYINHYLYDSKGNKIGFIQMCADCDEPFRIISIKSYDDENKTVKSANLAIDDVFENVFEFSLDTLVKKNTYFSDTISISKNHKRCFVISDSSIYLDLYYSKKGKLDSTLFNNICLGKNGKADCSKKTIFHYDQTGKIINQCISHFSETTKTNSYWTQKVYFYENGLIRNIQRRSSPNDKVESMNYIIFYGDENN